jgi:hypothetical protein
MAVGGFVNSILGTNIHDLFFKQAEPPVHILGVDFVPYEAGKSVAVNVHFTNTEPLRMTQGDVALIYYSLPEGVNWATDRLTKEETFWKSFQENGIKDVTVSPMLSSPVGQDLYFTIQGVTLSEEMIDRLRNGKAVLYYMASIKYKGGEVDLCGFGQSDKGATFLCSDHNTTL